MFLIGICFDTRSQTTSSNATVTIIGDPLVNGVNSDASPTDKDQKITTPQQIDPTFENGFHIRFDLVSPAQKIAPSADEKGRYTASGGSSKKIKRRHNPSLSKMQFNVKKRVNTWVPERKKKYRPHLCGRF